MCRSSLPARFRSRWCALTRRAAAFALAGLAMVGCAQFDKFQTQRRERVDALGRAWLSDQILPAEIDVAGRWQARGWGKSSLTQNGRDVRGTLGDYAVEGVVSGPRAYLLTRRNGWTRHAILLEQPVKDILIGYSSRTIPYRINDRQDLRLDRIRQ